VIASAACLRDALGPLRALAVGLAFAAIAGPAAGLTTGDPVKITGVVTDAAGRPLEGVQVVFVVSRSGFRMRDMARVESDLRRYLAVTDAQGSYTISWPWDPYFNRFELQAGVGLEKGKEDRFAVMERQSLTSRQLRAGAAVVPLVVKDTARLARLHAFESQLATEDERRVYAELGQPDEVRIVEYPDHREATWWYFASGRAYRFENGRLAQVVPFDPVRN